MLNKNLLDELIFLAIKASLEAGIKILGIYEKDFEVELKEDESPLTMADVAANGIITNYLIQTKIPILSEEGRSIAYDERKDWSLFWIVDPLDGTKEFVKRNGEFTVNIALIENGVPVLGVIYVPVHHVLYFGAKDFGSFKIEFSDDKLEPLNFATLKDNAIILPELIDRNNYRIVGSKSHLTPETKAYIDQLKAEHENVEILSRGSSLKICMIAEGSADIYPRFAPTMEWDIAAGHAIAKYAGKQIIHYETKKELTYNTESLVNPWFIVQ
jgi:3'(2'), 5'-bisphosphate nucleotidase